MKKKGCVIGFIIILIIGVLSILAIRYIIKDSQEYDAKQEEIRSRYTILEDEPYSIPAKSQMSLRVALTDSTATDDQVKYLLHELVQSSSSVKMKYHNKPTNVYVYIYKTKASYEAGSMNWIMMYAKNNSDKEGSFTYKPLVTSQD